MKLSNKFKKIFFLSQKIRMIEEKIIEIYPTDKIQSPVHLSIGQESIASCLCDSLSNDDWIFPTYRSHAIYIAKGGDINKMFAELYGKRSGIAEGKAGSMHLTDPFVGVMGASAVVASSIPHAVGAAYKSKFEKNNRIYVAIFGDGAVDQGVFHESLNFCSLNKLPVLFVCENNDLAVFTKRKKRQSFNISDLVNSYKIKNLKINDSWNYEKTSKTFLKTIQFIKKNKLPFFVEVDVCRYKEHVGINDDNDLGYRSLSIINKWKQKDHLIKKKKLYNKNSIKINKIIDDAISFAESSRFPGRKDLFKDSKYCFTKRTKINFYKNSSLSYRDALKKAMHHSMKLNQNSVAIGQGIDDPKKIFGTTDKILEKFGKIRSIDTPISEEGITGVCLGMSLNKIYPIQTHIRSDFLLLATNQIMNLIAKYQYMFGGLYTVPMLIRVVIGRSWGQGAQHSQSLQSLYSHIPGLKVIMPSSSQSVLDSYPKIVSSFSGPVISFEHRLLYDLQFKVTEKKTSFNPFSSILIRKGKDLTIVATSIMVLEAKRAADFVKEFYNIGCEIIDLHCTSDIDKLKILKSVKKTKKLLVADTSWANFGVCAEINRIINENCVNLLEKPVKSLSMKFTSCPTSKSLEDLFYPNQIDFVKKILELFDVEKKKLPSEKSMSDVYKKFRGPF
tara:strand:- start:1337 stop:3352 length:2016 start_codon:yes stop_codon:yes gene_type:complete